jgi:hypothetical protein
VICAISSASCAEVSMLQRKVVPSKDALSTEGWSQSANMPFNGSAQAPLATPMAACRWACRLESAPASAPMQVKVNVFADMGHRR